MSNFRRVRYEWALGPDRKRGHDENSWDPCCSPLSTVGTGTGTDTVAKHCWFDHNGHYVGGP